MANISQNVNIEMLEKLPDGTYKRKYPKTTKEQVDLGNVDNVKQASKAEHDQLATDFSAHQTDYTELKGDLSTLKTTAKDSIPNIVNELFTNVSSGKQLVGGAITGVDDSIVIPADPTFQQLADAIGGISTGKKWANVSVTYSAKQKTTINLTFKPSFIFARVMDTDYLAVYVDIEGTQFYNYSNTEYNAPTISAVGNDSFVLGSGLLGTQDGKAIEWIAYE